METKANYVTVGAFTVAVILAAFVFVYWVARVDTSGDNAPLDVVIEGSVTGLGVGSVVKFNGIDVGKVTNLRFDPDNPQVVIARAQVRRNLPITSSTKAVLGFTGLTGIAHIEFEGGDTVQQNVFEQAEPGEVPTIRADPSAVNNLLATAQDIFDRTDRVLSELEGFVSDVREPLSATLTNASKFSDALAKNSDNIDQFLDGIGSVGEALADVGTKLDGTLQGVERLLAAVDPNQVSTIVGNVEQFTGSLTDVSDQIREAANSVTGIVDQVGDVGTRVNDTFDRVQEILAAVPEDEINKALGNLGSITDDVKSASAEIATLTDGIGGRRDDIDRVITRVTEVADQAANFMDNVSSASDDFQALTASASSVMSDFEGVGAKVNGTIDKVDAILAAVPADKVTTSVDNISEISENLKTAVNEVAALTQGLGERREEVQLVLDRVNRISEDAELFMSNASDASTDFKTVTASASQLMNELESVGARIDKSFDRVDALLEAVPADQVQLAVEDIRKASEYAKTSLEEVKGLTEGIGDRQQDIETAISNASEMAERLNAASVRVDGILAKVDNMLDSEDGQSIVADARETLNSFKVVADSLNARVNSVGAGLEKFSGQGLRDLQNLINQTSRSVDRIERAITNIEQNPQQLIFGGEGDVKTFDGRSRR